MTENKSKISFIDILKIIGGSLIGLAGLMGLYLLFMYFAGKLNPDFVGTTDFTIVSISMFFIISLTFSSFTLSTVIEEMKMASNLLEKSECMISL